MDTYRVGDLSFRAGFRVIEASNIAGGPIELAFHATMLGEAGCSLLITGDRMRKRPGGIELLASIGDVVLPGLDADLPDMGGPATPVAVTSGVPLVQPLLANSFVRLEAACDVLRSGQETELRIACCRRIEVWPNDAPPSVPMPLVAEAHLRLPLRRDDAALGALARELVGRLRHLPSNERLQPLLLLLSLRAPSAVAQWRRLARSPDPAVRAYVLEALARLPRGAER